MLWTQIEILLGVRITCEPFCRVLRGLMTFQVIAMIDDTHLSLLTRHPFPQSHPVCCTALQVLRLQDSVGPLSEREPYLLPGLRRLYPVARSLWQRHTLSSLTSGIH